MRKLTVKEEIFADVYARTGNATLAYKRAGYSVNMKDKTIWTKAYLLKEKAEVRERIEAIKEKLRKEAVLDLDFCNTRLMNIIKASVSDLFCTEYDEDKESITFRMKSPDELEKSVSQAIKKVKIGKRGELEYEFYSPIDAIKQLTSLNTDRNLELEYKLLENMLDSLPDEAIEKIAKKVKNLHNLKIIENG